MKSVVLSALAAHAAGVGLKFEGSGTITYPTELNMGSSATCTKIDGTDRCIGDVVAAMANVEGVNRHFPQPFPDWCLFRSVPHQHAGIRQHDRLH
jgi:hypothetical protein